MGTILQPGRSLIFMKVGVHAREPIEEIIERKTREYETAGVVFWGYGGNTCHPRTIVQPFARSSEEQGNEVYLVMHKMNSNHWAEPKLATEYSEDGVDWQPVPKGVQVLGSRFAMVLDKLELNEFDLNLHDLSVAMGASRGMEASDYIRGHVDKGCFEVRASTATAPTLKHIDLFARVKSPYAVFLR